jgi:tRNA (Thr-GGU) A37 N-methylase
MELTLRPIGVVHNNVSYGQPEVEWEEIESEIEVNPEWADALDGIDDFSHVWVLSTNVRLKSYGDLAWY